MTSNYSPADNAAHRLYEQQFFQPGSRYGSRADYYRDQQTDRYRNDPAFRRLVDDKLAQGINHPDFDRLSSPAD